MTTKSTIDQAFKKALLDNFKNPAITPVATLAQVGARYHQEGNTQSLNAQGTLVRQHRPDDLDAYLQGLTDLGVPGETVEDQRQRLAQTPA